MRIKGIIFFLVFLSLQVDLSAQDFIQLDTTDEEVEFDDSNPDILNTPAIPENPTTLPLSQPTSSPFPIGSEKAKEKKISVKDPRRSFSFSYSPELYQYDLTNLNGTTNISLDSLGQYAQVSYDHWTKDNWGFGVDLSHRYFLFDELPAGIFPNSLSGNFLQVGVLLKVKLLGKKTYNEGLSFYVRYQYSIYDVELTVPVQVVDYTAHSLGIGFLYGMRFEKNRRLHFNVAFEPSFSFEEEPFDSGDRDSQLNLKTQAKYIFPWNEEWDVFFGYAFSLRKINFQGTGTRGIDNPEQKETVHSPSIGLMYEL